MVKSKDDSNEKISQIIKEEKERNKNITKKNSKEKKTSKEPVVEKKKRLYCGISNPIPNGYRLGTMQECFDVGKVMYYGVKKVDSKILSSNKNKEKDDIKSLEVKKGGLIGKYKTLKNKLEKKITEDEKKLIQKEIEDIKNEVNMIGEKIKKLKEIKL